ncbi:MAG: hypothetical protein XD77_1483 [Marinimicrobia bacterium 46_47]|nr:MAG: hypothetical protein XD77_1483 [Marinimicrobia bacterium 46_47]KUK92091.1 MAG: hypothetical protein XE04_0672 [Marinimicrobia bacterium 46_43]HBY18383.1 hypothetical protein [Candidatus Neomarinimicrobiota bacterium]
MDTKKILTFFAGIFTVTFVVSVIVTFFYSWIAHGTAMAEWGTSLRLAVILGIVMTWVHVRDIKTGK